MLKACPLLGGVQGSIAPPKFPNLILRAKQVWKIGNFMYFGQRNSLNFRKGSSFVRFAPSEAKKKKKKKHSRIFAKMPTFRKSGRDPLLKNLHPQTKILGMGLVEASQMHRLMKQGGLRELSEPPQYFEGGLEYSLAPPKKILYP